MHATDVTSLLAFPFHWHSCLAPQLQLFFCFVYHIIHTELVCLHKYVRIGLYVGYILVGWLYSFQWQTRISPWINKKKKPTKSINENELFQAIRQYLCTLAHNTQAHLHILWSAEEKWVRSRQQMTITLKYFMCVCSQARQHNSTNSNYFTSFHPHFIQLVYM